MKKLLFILLSIPFLFACGDDDKKTEPVSYTIKVKDISLLVGSITSLEITISPNKKVNDIIYTSLNPEIFSVDDKGKIKGLKVGKGLIKVASKELGTSSSGKIIILPIKAENLTLNKTSVSIEKGKSLSLEATISPKNTTNKELKWSSSDKSIADVDNTGKVTAINTGKCTISVSIDDKQAVCEVTVTPIKITSISITPTTYSIYEIDNLKYIDLVVGDDDKLIANILPNNAENKEVIWTSSSPDYVSVDNNGYIKSLKHSNTSIAITASTKDGSKEDVIHVNSKTINAYIEVITSSSITSLEEDYMSGEMYSSITNRSLKKITINRLLVVSNKTGKGIKLEEPNIVLSPNQTIEKGRFSIEKEYKPNYKFTWTFTYNGENYSISKDSSPKFN